ADWYTSCINILGKVLGQEKKAAKHISEVNAIISDIRTYTKAGDTTSTYVAGVTINGSNVWTTTFPTYLPLKLVDGINAYTGTATTPKVDLDAETVGKYKIDRVIIDPSSSDKIKEVSSQLVMNMINGRNTDDNKANDIKLFVTLPIVWDSINYDCVLAGSYYLCYLMHGTLTLEQVKEKINNVFTTYYGENGKNVFNDMSAFFVGKSSANNVELPLLGEVKIKETNGVFTVVSV
ncbi:MAG: ABC transporter substrate-binding protein, partial [Candidatus Methanomethylophilaceae archaeon]|nr:ABC transporter substrate-binding protein [Candidatus Methanomethylophilaceae archaeon]